MADHISVDPERMAASARGMLTFEDMFGGNMSRIQTATAQYMDGFGNDDFGRRLHEQYNGMALELVTNSEGLVDAVGRIRMNAYHSAEAWHQTSHLGGEPALPVAHNVVHAPLNAQHGPQH
ncbi:hypothetical protein [Actinomadura sp. DC4]|uniref:hypothetical protein n=1 Tax=Actinomadura sp. DC4 TaxID=3055069 RepID=UPI0025B04D38|nr:hypothetical protein [Actinomadura sp. DC4]MDN3354762.1 hypothetical protein [Actinomadura sp. DC4]